MFTKKFWVYSHGTDGELNKDLGEYDDFSEALRWGLGYFSRPDRAKNSVVRITERDKFGNYNTVWIAGPVEYMKDAFHD